MVTSQFGLGPLKATLTWKLYVLVGFPVCDADGVSPLHLCRFRGESSNCALDVNFRGAFVRNDICLLPGRRV